METEWSGDERRFLYELGSVVVHLGLKLSYSREDWHGKNIDENSTDQLSYSETSIDVRVVLVLFFVVPTQLQGREEKERCVVLLGMAANTIQRRRSGLGRHTGWRLCARFVFPDRWKYVYVPLGFILLTFYA